MENDEKMIDEILRHLDNELELGAARMSVTFDDQAYVMQSLYHISVVLAMADQQQRQ